MLFLLLPLLSIIGRAADNFTDCYGSCNFCDQKDLTLCSDKPNSCQLGFSYSPLSQSCTLMPAFNLYSNDTVVAGRPPAGWKLADGQPANRTMSCSTIKPQQSIEFMGPFTSVAVTKSFKVARSAHTLVSLFLLRLNWTAEDTLTLTIMDGNTIVRTDDISLGSFTGDNLSHISYFESCGNRTKDAIHGKNINYVLPGASNNGTLQVSLQPSLKSAGSAWAFTSIRVMTGCNSFMLSTEGTMCNSCPSGYYYNSSSLSCRQCHHYCKSCLTGEPDGCLSCPLLSILNGSTCKFSSSFNFLFDKLPGEAGAAANESVSSCGNTPMLGGPKYGKVGSVLSRRFTLPRHMFLRVEFYLVRIGVWQDYSLTLSVNGVPFLVVSQFNQALISPYCLSELGPVLCAQTHYASEYLHHRNSTALLEWKLTGPSPDAVYGIHSIKLSYYTCPRHCATCLLEADLGQKCETCNPFLTTSSNCLECPNGFFRQSTNETVFCQKCHVSCKNCNGEWLANCTECFENFQLNNGYCEVDSSMGFVPYIKDLTRYNWVDSNFVSSLPAKATTFNCGNYRLFGTPESAVPVAITRHYQLPAHSGLIIMLNVFKLGKWTSSNANITVSLDGDVFSNVAINASSGSTICQRSPKDFTYTFSRYFIGHTRRDVTLAVTAGGGIGLRDINILLKDCIECANNQLSFAVEYMPVYTLTNESLAIKIWVKFNKHLIDPASIQDGFRLSINNREMVITRQQYLWDLELYTPLNFSFVNDTLQVLADNPESVLSLPEQSSLRRRLLAPISQSLNRVSTTAKLARYDILTEDTMLSVKSMHRIFTGVSSTVLYSSLALVGLGMGLALEDFTIALQLIFMQIYVNSNQLPASLKLPLEGMQGIQHLNYFSDLHRRAIEGAILPSQHHQRCLHAMEQYHTDVTFIRGIYPIFIINLIYILFYVLLSALFCAVKSLSASQSLFVKWFKDIADRPVNYFDGMLRWQYTAVVWITACQLLSMHVSPVKVFQGFNNFFTIVALLWTGLYPLLIAFYLYRVRKIVLKDSFSTNYEDIFFKRIKNSQDEYDSFIYIAVRFLRLFFCSLLTGLLIEQEIAAPVIILIATLLELAYVLAKSIYLDRLLLLFKILEAIGFVVLEVVYVVMWAQSDKWPYRDYMKIGFIADAAIIWIMAVCFLRALYYIYSKLRDFMARNKIVEVRKERRVKTVRVGPTKYEVTPIDTNQTNRSILPSPTSIGPHPREEFEYRA